MLQPTTTVTLPGGFSVFSIVFSGDSNRLFAEVNWNEVNVWTVLVYFWPEVLGLLVGAFTILSVVVVARIIRTPRRPGVPYCRRCNYCLEALAADRCPECGTALVGKQTVLGRTLLRRLPLPASAGMLAALGYASLWVLHVGRTNALSDLVSWPSSRLYDWAKDHHLALLLQASPVHRTIAEIDVVSGAVTRSAFEPGGCWEMPLAVTPRGHELLFTDRLGRLALIDQNTHQVLRTLMRPDGRLGCGSKWGTGWHRVAGFSPDASTVYVSFWRDDDMAASLIGWNLTTGESQEVLTGLASPNNPASLLESDRAFVIVPGTAGPLVAETSLFGGTTVVYGDLSDLVIRDLSRPGAPIISTITGSFWSGSVPHFTADGTQFFRKLWQNNWSQWDVASGSNVAHGDAGGFGGTLSDTICYDAPRQRLFVAGTDRCDVLQQRGGVWEVVQRLQYPAGHLSDGRFAVSPDGRWFAVSHFSLRSAPVIVIYDVSSHEP